MKKLFKETLSSIKILALAFILALGIGMVSAATWQGPTASPPSGNVDAPLNVSSAQQDKAGTLRVSGFRSFGPVIFDDTIQISNGAGEGKVLTSDISGNASWQTGSVAESSHNCEWKNRGEMPSSLSVIEDGATYCRRMLSDGYGYGQIEFSNASGGNISFAVCEVDDYLQNDFDYYACSSN